MVQVDSGVGEVVLASDTAHYHEELEGDRPFSLFTSLPDMVRAYDTLRDLATRPQTRVIAGHDPRVRSPCSTRRVSGCLDSHGTRNGRLITQRGSARRRRRCRSPCVATV